MEKPEPVVLLLYVSALALILGRVAEGQVWRPTTPLCATQFSLVNHACSFLPYSPMPPPAPSGFPASPSPPGPDDPDLQHHHHHHHHNHHHHHHHHNHHHHHHHHHGHRDPNPVEADCCRWLREVDDACVCDLLVQLPAFLAKPAHDYTVVVPDVCNVTFSCSGRLRP